MWEPATAQLDTGTRGYYISSKKIDSLALGTYKKRSEKIGLSVDGKKVKSQYQITMHVKGLMDNDRHLCKFQTIQGLPVDVILGRTTINEKRLAVLNPESDMCRREGLRCTGN